jgi:DNA modification methylase
VPLFGWYVWDKLNGFPGDWNGRLAPAHEWIFHFTTEGERPNKTVKSKTAGAKLHGTQRNVDGSNKAFSQNGKLVNPFKIPDSVVRVIQENRDPIANEHPAPYPIGLPTIFIEAWQSIEIWYEPFSGSGTTLIAAERLGRKCYGMEIEPRYADVIIRRYEAETGQEAQLAERVSDDSTL